MFSQAAFAHAIRAEALPAAATPSDLDLTGPNGSCPAEFEDNASGADPAPTDLSVSPAPLAHDVLVPATGPPSSEQESLRREASSAAQLAFVPSALPGTAARTKPPCGSSFPR